MAADREGVARKEETPFLLDYLHHGTAGESLAANLKLVIRNAALAAEIAAAIARA
jgi:pseudouridylate synthase